MTTFIDPITMHELLASDGAELKKNRVHSAWVFNDPTNENRRTFKLCRVQLTESIFLGFNTPGGSWPMLLWSAAIGTTDDGIEFVQGHNIVSPAHEDGGPIPPIGVTTTEIPNSLIDRIIRDDEKKRRGNDGMGGES